MSDGARRSAQRRVLGERREVAVHAEQRFDDDEAVAVRSTGVSGEKLRQAADVVVRKHDAGAADSRMPSIRLAWLRSSENTTSPRSAIVVITPMFAR